MKFIVPIKSGMSIGRTNDGWMLFEVDAAYIIPINKHVGVHEIWECTTLAEVRQLLAGSEDTHDEAEDEG